MYSLSAPARGRFMPAAMEEKNRIREWRERRGLSQAQLAERMGLHQQAVHRLESGQHELKAQHLKAYARALGVRPIDILPRDMVDAPPGAGGGLFEMDEGWEGLPANDRVRRRKPAPKPETASVSTLPRALGMAPEALERLHVWTLDSPALEGAGLRRGDVLLVDRDRTPAPGDIVCAALLGAGRSQTVFRLYQPPFLLTANLDETLRDPLLIDRARVRIDGVVCGLVRALH